MDLTTARKLLEEILADVSVTQDSLENQFPTLRDVDAKAREARMVIKALPGPGERLFEEMVQDPDFEKQSRRVRLEAISNYCQTALRLMDKGAVSPRRTLVKAPDVSKLTIVLPDLDSIIQERWLEAQKCQYAGAFTAAVIMMGSILEALLLARAQLQPSRAHQSGSAPKDRKTGRNLALENWTLNCLIDVAVDLRWLKADRGRFGHALRDSRNVVHPWHHAQIKAEFDQATCETCWTVLNGAVGDLIQSI
jgi:hypothetical protein